VSTPRRVAVVPSTPALLPSYAGAVDPLPDLRRAAHAAAQWLLDGAGASVEVLTAGQRADNVARGVTEPLGARIAEQLLGTGTASTLPPGQTPAAESVLVVANGSATRSEKAPGHLDERAFAFDDAIARALRAGDPEALTRLDAGLGEQLWCHDVPALVALGGAVAGPVQAVVDHDDDPFGVRYWVVRWTCGS
jgi:hypothetical protein